MKVRPLELANVCALFLALRTDRIEGDRLCAYVASTQLLYSSTSAAQIVEQCKTFGLILKNGKDLELTDRGRRLGTRQQSVSNRLAPGARDFLLTNVYLDVMRMPLACQSFLLAFKVDTVSGTFVYDRLTSEGDESNEWLPVFHGVGLLEVQTDKALVRLECLPAFNSFLATVRNIQRNANESLSDADHEVGRLGEELAVAYEIKRLQMSGHPDLALLVQQISSIDNSAGYDLISHKGSGRHPEELLLIEVKGTTKPYVSFIWSRNERDIATQQGDRYWIYAFTHVDVATKTAKGPVRIRNPVASLRKLGYVEEPMDILIYRDRA